jgi:hypothetical protein
MEAGLEREKHIMADLLAKEKVLADARHAEAEKRAEDAFQLFMSQLAMQK